MQKVTKRDSSFNFDLLTPIAYAGEIDFKRIKRELYEDGIFIFTTYTNPLNPFFKEVREEMLRQDPRNDVKLVILGIRYNKEFIV